MLDFLGSFYAIAGYLLLGGLCLASCQSSQQETAVSVHTTKIAFGSCGHEDHELPIFNRIVSHAPDYFIFLGDNIYGDTKDMEVLRKKYEKLGEKPSYQNLKAHTQIRAVWDDHDFGWNDAGRHYPFKTASKDLFLEFFEEPQDSDRRKHQGIYHSDLIEVEGNTLQLIYLDNRTFRDDLLAYNGDYENDRRYFYGLDYTPHTSTDSTLLGAEQWAWLEAQLKVPADVRIICSGTQFGIEYNGYEAWANYPHEQKRLLELIKTYQANGVLFLTGDVHYAEISKLEYEGLYPIYDLTASGLSSTWHFATPNANRIEGPIMDNHFGLLTIKWHANDPVLIAEVWDIQDNQRIEYRIRLSEISF